MADQKKYAGAVYEALQKADKLDWNAIGAHLSLMGKHHNEVEKLAQLILFAKENASKINSDLETLKDARDTVNNFEGSLKYLNDKYKEAKEARRKIGRNERARSSSPIMDIMANLSSRHTSLKSLEELRTAMRAYRDKLAPVYHQMA